MRDRPTRRQLLELTGITAVAGLAGCTSLRSQPGSGDGGDGGDGGDDPDHTEEPEPSEKGDGHDEGDGGDGHDGEEEGHHDEGDGGDGHDEKGDGHDGEEEGHHDEGDGHGHNHDEGLPEEPSQTAEVILETEGQRHHYRPHVVWIEPGGTVTWQLESGSHDAVAYHPDNDRPRRIPEEADPWSTELLSEEGATAEHTFGTEGVYDYYCTPHESVGMVGTVVVGDPDPHEQPALEDPQSSLPEGARSELADLADNVDELLGHTH